MILPPHQSGKENFTYSSFVCACERHSIITQTDLNGQQRQQQKLKEDRQLYEMIKQGFAMVYRHQKILLQKEVEPCDSDDSDESGDDLLPVSAEEAPRQFRNYNEQLI